MHALWTLPAAFLLVFVPQALAETLSISPDNVTNWGQVAGQSERAIQTCPFKIPSQIATVYQWSKAKHGDDYLREYRRGFDEVDSALKHKDKTDKVCEAILAVIGPSGSMVDGFLLRAGTARVCLVDEEIHLSKRDEIELPATTILKDAGDSTGKKEDPSTWRHTVHGIVRAAIITTKPIVLSPKAPCADVPVKMYTSPSYSDKNQKAADNHIFEIDDVEDYPIPAKKPVVEFGKLVDDIGVEAVLLTDVDDVVAGRDHYGDSATNSAVCLKGAQSLAIHMGQGISGQNDLNIFLGQIDGGDVTMGCAKLIKYQPDIYVGWFGSAMPPHRTVRFIARAGAYLTGATEDEISAETSACAKAALAPDAGEISQREFRGVGVSCQAFARDGGGGSVTIFRRYGAYPSHAAPSAAELASLEIASGKLKAREAAKAGASKAFAEWWQDPSIPTEAKTFAMMTARVIALGERCPSQKVPLERIAAWAKQLNVDPSDFGPGGKYLSYGNDDDCDEGWSRNRKCKRSLRGDSKIPIDVFPAP